MIRFLRIFTVSFFLIMLLLLLSKSYACDIVVGGGFHCSLPSTIWSEQTDLDEGETISVSSASYTAPESGDYFFSPSFMEEDVISWDCNNPADCAHYKSRMQQECHSVPIYIPCTGACYEKVWQYYGEIHGSKTDYHFPPNPCLDDYMRESWFVYHLVSCSSNNNDGDPFSQCDGDCDDNDPNIYTGATEVCDGVDNNCDQQVDEGFDNDNDGYTTCNGDCDDTDFDVYPGAQEICDGKDNDCDQQTDEDNDDDNDGYSTCNGDCNDIDPTVFPGASEICDGIDNNCNGSIDEGLDTDGDGYTSCDEDCDDTDPTLNPGAEEVCDGVDNNCDGIIDDICAGEDDPCKKNPNSTDMGSSANVASGNLFHSQEILRTKGSGLTAEITMSYNSMDTYSGPLGRGWTHNYSLSVVEHGGKITLKEDDGKRTYFEYLGYNAYSSVSSSGRHAMILKNIDESYTLTEKSGMKYWFDTEGRLSKIIDRNNNALILDYSGSDLISLSDSYGRQTTFAYDANNRITLVTDPAGRSITFSYTSDLLSSVTGPLGDSWSYTYDGEGKMLTKTDPVGNMTTYTYDVNGRIITSIDPEGNTKSISYIQTNNIATITEKNGSQWTGSYDNSLNVPLQITGTSGGQITYQYDTERNLISSTDQNGIITSYTYDNDGNMLTKTEAVGTQDERTTLYVYTSYGHVTRITDQDGYDTQFQYDINGNLKREIDDQGNVTTYSYTSHGKRVSMTDRNDNTTIYNYDQYGNISTITNALTQTVSYTYDIMGNPLSMTDANSNITTYEYDLGDRLTKETRPDGGVIIYEYDNAGNRTAVTDANGNRTTFTYDGLNRPTKTTDPEGNSINYTYDEEGNNDSIIVKDSLNNIITSTTYTYDDYNNLVRTTHADGTYTEQSYDAVGNVLTRIDENGNITNYSYDVFHRLVSVTDPNSGVTSYTYDIRNNLLTVTDANANTTTYTYNSINRLTSTSSPDTNTTTYTYDAQGNILTKTDDSGITLTYGYDELNRQTAIQFPDSSQNITYTYDEPQYQNGIGRLTTMTDPSGSTTYDYDSIGRIVKEFHNISGLNYSTDYEYDLNGNLVTMLYPGGREIAYTYNLTNKVTSVTETNYGMTNILAENITYLPFGDMVSITQGNGIITTITYNNRYQLNDLNIGTLKSLSYTRDNVGNITGIADNIEPAKTKNYTYDNLYRLTLATGQWGAISYEYDPTGNRTYETTDTGNTTYNYTLNTNKLASATGEKALSFNYDNNGNTTTENTKQFIYNQNQRLTQMTDSGNFIGEYVYNGKGQRAEKWIPSQNKCTIFHYDQSGLIITESSSAGTIRGDYVYLNGQPLAKLEGSSVYYYHNDHLETPMLMTDKNTTVVWEGEYLPFGEAFSVTGSVTNNLRFPGQYYDEETGMHYNYFRDYKPEIGRYIEADPIGIEQGINHLYVYTLNNPVNFVDPLGQAPWYGNYCGPGNNPSAPIDNLDNACKLHDTCYEDRGLSAKDVITPPEEGLQCTDQQMCDIYLCMAAQSFHPSNSKQAAARRMIILIFCDKGGL